MNQNELNEILFKLQIENDLKLKVLLDTFLDTPEKKELFEKRIKDYRNEHFQLLLQKLDLKE